MTHVITAKKFARIDLRSNRVDRLVATLANTGCLSWRGIQRKVEKATGVFLTQGQIQGRLTKAEISVAKIRNGEDKDATEIQRLILKDRTIIERSEQLVISRAPITEHGSVNKPHKANNKNTRGVLLGLSGAVVGGVGS